MKYTRITWLKMKAPGFTLVHIHLRLYGNDNQSKSKFGTKSLVQTSHLYDLHAYAGLHQRWEQAFKWSTQLAPSWPCGQLWNKMLTCLCILTLHKLPHTFSYSVIIMVYNFSGISRNGCIHLRHTNTVHFDDYAGLKTTWGKKTKPCPIFATN